MKRLLPGYKGTYTKCLQPLFGDSLSHAEVIIWDEKLIIYFTTKFFIRFINFYNFINNK